MCLEEKRVRLLNRHRLDKEKKYMVQNGLNAFSKDEDALVSWKNRFGAIDVLRYMVCKANLLKKTYSTKLSM